MTTWGGTPSTLLHHALAVSPTVKPMLTLDLGMMIPSPLSFVICARLRCLLQPSKPQYACPASQQGWCCGVVDPVHDAVSVASSVFES